MKCAKCAAENREGRKFCARCGAPLARSCPQCGASNEPGEDFCGECGAPLGKPSAPSAEKASNRPILVAETSASENPEGERKTVTALFADIKGSMDLIEDLDPEEAQAIVEPALKLMMEAVHHYGGHVAQTTGDGIFALFGAPVAHEDHPQRALLAALRMQAEVRRYAEKLRAEQGVNLQVRVGANTGEVVVREIRTGKKQNEYVPIGHSTSVAARLQALAVPGSIAITESMGKLVEGYFVLKSLGPARIKGVTEPIEIHEVLGSGPLRTRLQRGAIRGYTKFVGRQREMDAMKHVAEMAKAGHGQIVTVVAEPGVGKSRLLYEFKATSQNGWLVLEGVSFSHGKTTAYLPLIELLNDYFAIGPDDGPSQRREKVAGKVTMLDRSLEETLPHLFGLLGIVDGTDPLVGMDEQIRRRRTQEAVKRILLRESVRQPLMLIFEDLHLIDDATQGFLNLLAEGIASSSALLLVNYRPEYTDQWSSKTYYTRLRLDPLGKESAAEILGSRIGDSPDLAPVKRLIFERTEGNPLFIEELVEALFDEGVLVRNGTVKVTRPISQLKIPPTVRGILAARIDRLPPDAKELLQTLAVIGSQFPLALVRQVVQLRADRLDSILDVLQAGEFIYEQPTTGDVEYTFKHALTHEMAYNSLLTRRRRVLHEQTARAIETLYRERLDHHYTDLAHHYRWSNNAPRAVEYLHLAGELEARRGDYTAALASVDSALRMLEGLPKGPERLRAELMARLLEGMCVPPRYGAEERLQRSQRVCELSEQLGDTSSLVRGLLSMASVYLSRGDLLRAQELFGRCVEVAEASHIHEALFPIHFLAALQLWHAGALLQASSIFSDLMKSVGSAREGAYAYDFLQFNLWPRCPAGFAGVQHALGRPEEALRFSDESLRRARQLNHPLTLAMSFGDAATLRYSRREPEAARALAEAQIALAEEYGFPDQLARGLVLRGWAMTELGQAEQGVAQLEASVLRNFAWPMQVSAMQAQGYARVGRADQVVRLLDRVIRLAHEEAELHRLKGEAILMDDSSGDAEAEACFRKAVELARSQSAKWWELRAAVSLARLLAKQGKRDEARTMLAEIYGWFTEGHDTADLKDAKALLDHLNG